MISQNKAELLVDSLPFGYSEYLKICTDPYHDTEIRFEGAPTSRNASSVCLCYNQEQTYSAEDFGINFAVTPTWDAHFAMFPFLQKHEMYSASRVHNSAINDFQIDAAVNTPIYPMSVHGVPSGTQTYSWVGGLTPIQITGLQTNALTSFTSNSTADDGYGLRTLRIVGEAFEVIDESPDIYQQGSCTVYRYPLDNQLSRVQVRLAGANPATIPIDPTFGLLPTPYDLVSSQDMYQLRLPPTNTSTAVLVPGSQTWKAKEGAYVVGTQFVSEVPFKQCDDRPIALTTSCPSTTPSDPTGYYAMVDQNTLKYCIQGDPANPETGIRTYVDNPDIVCPFNLSGAYFTGLSSQYGALRLRYRVYVEILADPADTTLTPLTSPTLPYKQDLQEFVMKVISDLPAGVQQSMNPSAEHWRNILHKIGKAAQTLSGPLSALSPEVGMIIGGGGSLLARATRPKGQGNKNNKGVNNVQYTPNLKKTNLPRKETKADRKTEAAFDKFLKSGVKFS